MTTTSKLADHPYAVMAGTLTCAVGLLAAIFTPSGLVVLAAGVALVLWYRLRPSAAWSAVGAVAGAAAGTIGTLSVRTEKLCCMFGWSEARGWPYAWLSRGASADTPEAARALAYADGWAPDPVYLVTDVMIWASAGFLLVVAAGLAVRAYRARRR
ncbi:hypothetical protein [Actinoplanes sp. HUAS TT8]|uniref:hypothetical protein n=1 Tax=Actinoplanes sp. HUAS TT8 TaxID=3447453 RepID=UPI003F51D5CF